MPFCQGRARQISDGKFRRCQFFGRPIEQIIGKTAFEITDELKRLKN